MSNGGTERAEDLIGTIITDESGRKFQVKDVDGEDVIVGTLGDRLLDECPVEYGDICIDPDCNGRVGEYDDEQDDLVAHELFCFGCGLNWVERSGHWEENYVEWPTTFTFAEHVHDSDTDHTTEEPNEQ